MPQGRRNREGEKHRCFYTVVMSMRIGQEISEAGVYDEVITGVQGEQRWVSTPEPMLFHNFISLVRNHTSAQVKDLYC